MVIIFMVNLLMVKRMAMEYIVIIMEILIKVNSQKINKMDLE